MTALVKSIFYTNIFFLFTMFCISIHLQAQNHDDIASTIPYQSQSVVIKTKEILETGSGNKTLLNKLGFIESKELFRQTMSKDKQKNTESIIYKLKLQEGITVENAIQLLNKLVWVEYAEPIYQHELLYEPTLEQEPWKPAHWGHINANIYTAWDSNAGDTNLIIGIVDAGVFVNHPQLKQNLYYNDIERYGLEGIDDDNNGFVDDSLGYDIADNDADVFNNTIHHGTEVSGIISAPLNDSTGSFGVAPHCKFMPIKIAIGNSGFLTNGYEGILYAAQNGCKIINLSWGRTGFPSQFEQDVINEVIENYGVLLVAAAGNDNIKADYYPASYNHVISVAHIDINNKAIATYSPFIDLAAPGFDLPSTNQRAARNFHGKVYGSSFASPFVAGAAALVWTENPSLTAGQVAEVMRHSANSDIYDNPDNASKIGFLGQGRLDAGLAIENPFAFSAVRMTDWEILNGVGATAISQGMSVVVNATFTNMLKPTNSNFRITLDTEATDIEVLDTLFEAGEIGTLEQKEYVFNLKIAPNATEGYQYFFLTYHYENGRTDKQYFIINIDSSYLDINFNDIATTIDANGRIGYTGDGTYNQGIGFYRVGSQYISKNGSKMAKKGSIGLIIIQDENRISDCLSSSDTTKSRDFEVISPTLLDSITPLIQITHNSFTDRNSPNPIGIDIKQDVIGNKETAHKNYILIKYTITNTNNHDLDSLKVGLFADWDLTNGENTAIWNEEKQFAMTIAQDSTEVAGILAFGYDLSHFSMLMNKEANEIDFTDGFTKSEKFKLLNSGISTESLEGNIAQTVGTTLYQLPANTSKEVYFALMATQSIDSMLIVVDTVKEHVKNTYFSNTPIPVISNTAFCKESELEITPQNGTNFRLYSDIGLTNFISQGVSFPIALADTGKTFYVTNADFTIESEATPVTLRLAVPNADFTLNTSEVNIYTEDTLKLYGPSAVSWSWDLGDGSISSEQNPIIAFNQVGEYTISLTVSNGICNNQSSQIVKAVSEQPIWSNKTLENYLSVYPNPSIGNAKLRLSNPEFRDYEIQIISTLGKVVAERQVFKREGNPTTLDFSGLGSGLYILKIKVNGASATRRIFIQNE